MEAMYSPVLGYLRFPTFGANQLYFVAEDNLWEVSLMGGRAQRLTESRSELQTPRLSPCGRWLALVAAEEGEQEVVRPAQPTTVMDASQFRAVACA